MSVRARPMKRLLNRSGFRHGPLNRRIDRIEAWSRLALVLAFVVVAGPATWSVGDAVARAGMQQEQAQRTDRHQVVARLLQVVPDPDAGALTLRTFANAEWTEPDGSTHRAVVRLAPDHKVASTQPLWTATSGTPVTAPQSRADTVTATAAAVFLVAILVAGVLGGVGALLHHRFDERRGQQWDDEWQRVEPDWTHRP